MTVSSWPALPLLEWKETYDTLHMWTQVVGKIRLALTPRANHWWNTALYVSPRGLTTSTMYHNGRLLQIDFDFVDHKLLIETTDVPPKSIDLRSRTVADFYQETMAALNSLEMPVKIWTTPVEVENRIPFERDQKHASYDPEYVQRCWQILVQTNRVFTKFRSRFIGKVSPVHFFWGAFDMAVTRFSGRPAPLHPGVPNCGIFVMQEAYSHEVSSCGFWPGSGMVDEPAFYAYAYPVPAGLADASVAPGAAAWNGERVEGPEPVAAARPDRRRDRRPRRAPRRHRPRRA